MERERKLEVEKLISEGKFSVALSVLQRMAAASPRDIWVLGNLCFVCYQLDQLKPALKYAQQAYETAPDDPWVIWDYASILDEAPETKTLGREHFMTILRKRPDSDRLSLNKTDQKKLLSLQNDCRFRIGMSYYDIIRRDLARRWLHKYLEFRCNNVPSLYPKKAAQDALWLCENIKRIERCLDSEQWAKSRVLLKQAIKKTPKDRWWFLAELSRTYYEDYNYEKSFEVIKQAIALAPTRPLAMWYYGTNLEVRGEFAEAIQTYEAILRKGAQKIGMVETSKGLRWAHELMNRCRYRMAVCYRETGNQSEAIRLLKLHLNNRNRGLRAYVPISKVREELTELA